MGLGAKQVEFSVAAVLSEDTRQRQDEDGTVACTQAII